MRIIGNKSDTTIKCGILTAALVLSVAVSTFAQTPVTPPGTGTEVDPYLISEIGHLVWMSDTVAESAGKYYTMTADIDASDTANWNDEWTSTDHLEGFKPIGPDFIGVFDGKDHTITGLVINRPTTNNIGLFSDVGFAGYGSSIEHVKNLGILDCTVSGNMNVGGMIGNASRTEVTNCYITGAVTGWQNVGGLVGYSISGSLANSYAASIVNSDSDYVGGLVGAALSSLSNCYATGSVVGNAGSVGGLIGYSAGTLSNCYATSDVTGTGEQVGGLVGYNEGPVSNCHATGAVVGNADAVGGLIGSNIESVSNCYATGTVTGHYEVGGLIGYSQVGKVSDCYATGAVSGSAESGGLVGYNKSSITNSHATGEVSWGGGLVGNNQGPISYCYATGAVIGNGGLIGSNYSTVSYCYATGTVSGHTEIGGLVGYNGGTLSNCYASGAVLGDSFVYYLGGLAGRNGGIVSNCYATGAVIAGSWDVGGLVGYPGGSVSASYWDVETTGQSTSNGGGTGKTTAEMMQQATFVYWDFTDIWDIGENETYPYLQNMLDDLDGDGVIDQLDACLGTIPGITVDAQGCPPEVPGDINRDGDVDADDLESLKACFSGPTIPYAGTCDAADDDADGDVDLTDFGAMQRCFSGENVPADSDCAN